MTNADLPISSQAANNTPRPFEIAGKDGEDQWDQAEEDSILTRFLVSHAIRDASACEKHVPSVI